MAIQPSEADRRCVLSCLKRLLARRRGFEDLGLCARDSPCAWHLDALDRAIVSYLLLADELGLAEEARSLFDARLSEGAERDTAAAERRGAGVRVRIGGP